MPRLAVSAIVSAFLMLGAIRVTDNLHLLPVSREGGTALSLLAAFLAAVGSLAGQIGLAPRTSGTTLRRLTWGWLIAVAVFAGLHGAFVFGVPDVEEGRGESVVISFSRADCEGDGVDCRGQTNEQCLEGLAYRRDLIASCWGEGRIRVVWLTIMLSILLVSGGSGGLVGLAALRVWPLGAAADTRAVAPLRLFLCYRRADSAEFADRLHDRLSEHFGAGNVFRDVEAIRLGEDFRQAVRRALARCDVFLLVIGPRWLEIRDDDGARRVDRPDDPVRIEIETAIARGLLIVPVLVGGARMPRSDQMPDGFEELSNRAGAAIHGDPTAPDDPAFTDSVDELIQQLEQAHELEPASRDRSADGSVV